MKFLDLSNWNTIENYDGIKNNYCGVICKATEGKDYIDSSFKNKMNALKSNNIKVGAYHFFRGKSGTLTDGYIEAQASNFYNTIKDFTLDIIPVLDVENDEFGGIGQTGLWVEKFAQEFKRLSGMDLIIYSGWYFIKDNFTLEERKKYNWWVANYGISALPQIDGCNFIAWQYTDSENVSGINGGVDSSNLLNETLFYINRNTNTSNSTNSNSPKSSIYEYDETGIANVIVDVLNIRDYPSTSKGNIVGKYSLGESFNYNHVIIDGGYVWVRYTAYSGNVRYVAVKNVADGTRYANCK